MSTFALRRPPALNPLIAEAKRRARHRRSVLIVLAGVALVAVAAVTLLRGPGGGGSPTPSANGRASNSSGSASRVRGPARAAPGYVSYPSEGVRLAAPPRALTPRISAAEALRSFKGTGFGAFAGAVPPTVRLHTVTYHGDVFPAWVVTYRKTRATYYGPAHGQTKPECNFVGIYDLHAATWKTFFQDCSR